jgi:hypothetical protein
MNKRKGTVAPSTERRKFTGVDDMRERMNLAGRQTNGDLDTGT